MTITLAVLLGFALDWLLGDPKKLPHPVCAVGKLISAAEKVLRRIFPATPAALTFAGILLWLITCGMSFAVPFFLLRWLYHVNFWFGFAAETLLCWMISHEKPCGRRLSCLRRDQAVARGGPQGHRVVRRPRHRRAVRGGRYQGRCRDRG